MGLVPKFTLWYNTWHRENTLPPQLPARAGNPRFPCLCEPGAGAAVTPREKRTHATCSPSEPEHCHKFLSWKTRPAFPRGAKWSQIFAFLFTSLKQLSDRKLSLSGGLTWSLTPQHQCNPNYLYWIFGKDLLQLTGGETESESHSVILLGAPHCRTGWRSLWLLQDHPSIYLFEKEWYKCTLSHPLQHWGGGGVLPPSTSSRSLLLLLFYPQGLHGFGGILSVCSNPWTPRGLALRVL